jgi:hypothetical protein
MAAMNMVSARGFSGVSFHLRTCPQGVACVLSKKTPILFGSRRSKLDHLTVCFDAQCTPSDAPKKLIIQPEDAMENSKLLPSSRSLKLSNSKPDCSLTSYFFVK